MKRKAVTYEVTFTKKPTVTVYFNPDANLDEGRVKEEIFETLYTDLYDYIQPYNLDIKLIEEKEFDDGWDY